jgi:3-oxoacyl-[acyl-carrier protein] reductase
MVANMSERIVLITGTRKGIGRYLADFFLEKGDIVIGCSRQAADIVNERYHHFSLSVSDEAEVIKMFTFIRSKFGRLDILINNAGTASMNHILLTPVSTVNRLFETNFLGTFLCSREAAKLMKKNGHGRIINFTTIAVALNLEGETVYAASKAAVEQLTKNMAKEVGSFGITVNAIGPTPVETDLIKAVPKGKIDELLNQQIIKRFGEFSDVKNVIEFFISPASSFVTGQILYLGGIEK